MKASSRWKGPPRTVLLLDDEPLLLRATARTFRAIGLEPITTTDPAEALTIVERDAPHVVISDLHMPDECGARFLANVAALRPDVLRVLMSADPDFRPRVGTLAAARAHAMMSKARIGSMGDIIIEQLRARIEVAETHDEREALAKRVARGLARPGHEDDCHRERVARSAALVAAAMGLTAAEIEQTRLGALLHDVGQIAVPEQVFERWGTLTPYERSEIARHPVAGHTIVASMPALRDALPVIAAHHERRDGTGYPEALAGDAIPRTVSAFQVADAYDAMTTTRHYRGRRSRDEAIAELSREAGHKHDPEAVRALVAMGPEAF